MKNRIYILFCLAACTPVQEYSTCENWDELVAGENFKYVPLARLKATGPSGGIFRVDLHARCSRDGRIISVDATHEGMGRQMYILSISHILDHPPG